MDGGGGWMDGWRGWMDGWSGWMEGVDKIDVGFTVVRG